MVSSKTCRFPKKQKNLWPKTLYQKKAESSARSDRLEVYKKILNNAFKVLKPGGEIEILDGFFENGRVEGIGTIQAILENLGFEEIQVIDYPWRKNQQEQRTIYKRYFIDDKARLIQAKKPN
jgi:hypothetical protein